MLRISRSSPAESCMQGELQQRPAGDFAIRKVASRRASQRAGSQASESGQAEAFATHYAVYLAADSSGTDEQLLQEVPRGTNALALDASIDAGGRGLTGRLPKEDVADQDPGGWLLMTTHFTELKRFNNLSTFH